MFKLNFKKLVSDLEPFFLRLLKHLAYLRSAAKPLKDINDSLIITRDKINFDLSFTGQKIYLQEILNQLFDTASRRIFIENQTDFLLDNFIHFDVEQKPPFFLHFEAEGKPPTFFSFETEYGLDFDFVVFVPSTLTFDENEMRALVNKYRAAGRTFDIQTF